MKTIKTTRITATDVHEKLIGQLEALVTSEDWKAFLRTAARFHRYSANNCMLILAQCPEATQVASFTTWRSFGRFPRRNETAIRILAPCKYRKEVAADESRKVGEQEWILAGFRVASVFDISQTEGTPLPDAAMPVLLEGEAPVGMWEAIKSLIKKEGFSVARADCGNAQERSFVDADTFGIFTRHERFCSIVEPVGIKIHSFGNSERCFSYFF